MNIAKRRPREIRAQHEINEIRFELGLSQAEFGELMGVAQTTISKWETGSKSPIFQRGSLLYIWFRGPIKAARIANRIMQAAFSE